MAHEEFKAEDVMVGDSIGGFRVVGDTCKYLEPKAGGEAFRRPLLKLRFGRVLSLRAYAYHQKGYIQKVFLKVLKTLTGEAFVRGSQFITPVCGYESWVLSLHVVLILLSGYSPFMFSHLLRSKNPKVPTLGSNAGE
jgi:hypothetical protein